MITGRLDSTIPSCDYYSKNEEEDTLVEASCRISHLIQKFASMHVDPVLFINEEFWREEVSSVVSAWQKYYSYDKRAQDAISVTFTKTKINELTQELRLPLQKLQSCRLLFGEEGRVVTHIRICTLETGTSKTVEKLYNLAKKKIDVYARMSQETLARIKEKPDEADHLAKKYREKIEHEYSTWCALKKANAHEGIVPHHALITADGSVGLLLEYCEGGDLSSYRLEGEKPLKIARQSYQHILEVIETLITVHAAGFVHRDIKPENIFLKSGKAVIGDLETMVQTGSEVVPCGSIWYVAPEVMTDIVEEVHPSQDAWAIGIMLYEFTTGHDLIDEEIQDQIENANSSTLQLNIYKEQLKAIDWSEIEDDTLAAVIRGLLQLDPKKRMTLKDAAIELKKFIETQHKLLQETLM